MSEAGLHQLRFINQLSSAMDQQKGHGRAHGQHAQTAATAAEAEEEITLLLVWIAPAIARMAAWELL